MADLGPCPLCGGTMLFSDDGFAYCSGCGEYPHEIRSPHIHNRLSAMGELWRKKEAEKSLVDELVAALPDPTLLDMLANWFDTEQHFRPHWKRTGVQNDLRKWARAAHAVLEKARKRDET